jgi:predicted ThiF/HesA family dinucleotide-utilizing enzyme
MGDSQLSASDSEASLHGSEKAHHGGPLETIYSVDTQEKLAAAEAKIQALVAENAELSRNFREELEKLQAQAANGEVQQLYQAEIDNLKKQLLIATESGGDTVQLQNELANKNQELATLTERLNNIKQMELQKQKAKFIEVSNKQKEVFLKQKAKLEQAVNHINFLTAKKNELTQALQLEKERVEKILAAARAEHEKLGKTMAEKKNIQTGWESEKSELELRIHQEQGIVLELRREVEDLKRKLEEKSKIDEVKSQMHIYVGCRNDFPEVGEVLKAELLGVDNPQYQWYRSFAGTQFVAIRYADEITYRVSPDDVGAVLKVEVTSGQNIKIAAETQVVQLSKEHVQKLHEYLMSKKAIEFPVTPISLGSGGGEQKQPERFIQVTKEKIKLREGKKTMEKKEWTEHIKVVLHHDSPVEFTLHLGSDKIYTFPFVAANPDFRDLIMVVIRAFQVVVAVSPVFFLFLNSVLYQHGPKDKEPDVRYLNHLVTHGAIDAK